MLCKGLFQSWIILRGWPLLSCGSLLFPYAWLIVVLAINAVLQDENHNAYVTFITLEKTDLKRVFELR